MAGVPANVLVQGQQCPTDVDNKGKITTEIKDPLEPIETSPFEELLKADEAWVKKYGGSDVSILAYNISVLMKGQKDAKNQKSKEKN